MTQEETKKPNEEPKPRGMSLPRVIGLIVFALLFGIIAPFAYRYFEYRSGHSITEDAFVEAQMVHVGAELVSGRIVRMAVRENDFVQKGQVLFEIEPETYLDLVAVAEAKLAMAKTEKTRQEIGLEKLRKEVPLTIAFSRKTLDLALAEQVKAQNLLKLTQDEISGTISESDALVGVAQANQVLAQQEFERFMALHRENAVTLRRAQEVSRANDASKAELKLAQSKQGKANSARTQIEVVRNDLNAATAAVEKATVSVAIAQTGTETIREAEQLLRLREEAIAEASTLVHTAKHHLKNTRVVAPISGVVVKRNKNTGDHVTSGLAVLTMYDPELLYVTANMEETRLQGVVPGNRARIEVDASHETIPGRVLWINHSTGAEFSLLPRNVVTGEFTKVIQRVPIRIAFESGADVKNLRAGYSVRVIIAHGKGDADWVKEAQKRSTMLDSRFDEEPEKEGPKR